MLLVDLYTDSSDDFEEECVNEDVANTRGQDQSDTRKTTAAKSNFDDGKNILV